MADVALCDNKPKLAFTDAPRMAVRVNRWRGLMISGRLRNALSRVPVTKPSCTDNVNQLAADSLRFHSFVSAGTTAEPLNQSDMPRSSATARTVSVRQRDDRVLSDRESVGPNKAPDCNAKASVRSRRDRRSEFGGQKGRSQKIRGQKSEVRYQSSNGTSEQTSGLCKSSL